MNMKSLYIKYKVHIFYLALIIFSILIFYRQFISTERTLNGEFNIEGIDLYEQIRKSSAAGEFPHWINAWHGGMPFHQHSEKTVIFYTSLIALIMPNTVSAVNLTILLHAMLLGISMYYVMIYFGIKPRYAFVSSFIMLYARFPNSVSVQYIHRYGVIAWTPLLFLFLWKTLNSKNKQEMVNNSIISGIILAIQFSTGGLDYFVYLVAIFIAIYLTYLASKRFPVRAIKAFLIGIILSTVFFGLVAVRALPLLDFEDVSSKEVDFTYEQMLGNKINIWSPKLFVYQVFGLGKGEQQQDLVIGIAAFTLVLIALFSIKKRYVLAFSLVALFGILMSTGTYFLYPLWKFVPGFAKIHHVHRSAYIFIFGAAALAAIGLQRLENIIEKRLKLSRIILSLIGFIIIFFIIFELWIIPVWINADMPIRFGKDLIYPKDYWYKHLAGNQLYKYLQQEKEAHKEIFRVNNYGTNTVNGFAGTYAIYMNQEILFGSISIWIPEYMMEYLSISFRDPAKFWGMLNAKYVYYMQPLNISGLKFVKKFEECSYCLQALFVDQGISGPYLYLNEKYLPRAYYAEHAVLIIGNKNYVLNAMYNIMLADFFNPSNTVIIYGGDKSVNDYDIEFLKNVDAIILLSGYLGQSTVLKLQEYQKYGRVFPDVIKGENSINLQNLSELFSSFDGSYENVKKAEIIKYTDNSRIIKTERKGWLVLAEKFYMFPDWKARYDGKVIENIRANGVNTVYYIDGSSNELKLEYKPKSFRDGMIISIITGLLILAYFMLQRFIYGKKSSAKDG